MRPINRYLSNKIKAFDIKATNYTINKIVKDELDRLGHNADLNHIDVSQVTNMDSLFSCYSDDLGPMYDDLNPDISKWDVSNVIDMRDMFAHCHNFNCDISGWDVSKVEDMIKMFFYCESFKQDISRWDVSKVKRYNNIFEECYIKEEYMPKFNI